jgi:hypothetical protein
VPIQEGANTLTATATDPAGNTGTASIQVTFDQTPPGVTITSPANGITLHTPEITVTGTVSDGVSGVAGVICNGSAASVTGATFVCVLSLSEGANAIIVQATDIAGNVGTA